MKSLKSIVLFTIFFIALTGNMACKKDCPVPVTNNIVPGLWIGTYTVDQVPAQGALYYSFIFKPDNKLLTESVGGNGVTYYTQGSWTLSGSDLTCTYSSINFPGTTITQSAKFTYTASSDSLSAGTWKDVAGGGTYTGKFQSMKKVK